MSATRHSCDVVVVGAGPAGIAAGVTAAATGVRTLVVDEGIGPGGQIWRPARELAPSGSARAWLERLTASSATVLRSTSVISMHRDERGLVVLAESAGGPIEITAARLILATGARELFLPFPGWTLPNVIGIGGAQALLKAGTDFRGRRVVISGSGPLMLPVAASLAAAGAKLILVAEQAPLRRVAAYGAGLWQMPLTLLHAAALRWKFAGAPYRTGVWVASAHGDQALSEVSLSDGRSSRTLVCDILCTGFGLVPNNELARLVGCNMRGRFVTTDDDGRTSIPAVYAAGETTGIGGVDAAIVEGQIAGVAAAGGHPDARLVARKRKLARSALVLERTFAPRAELRALATSGTIVCRCEDVRFGELSANWTSRQSKLYTRAGMGACQGRVCGAALECVMGWTADSVRPPVQPARLSTLITDFSATTTLPPTT